MQICKMTLGNWAYTGAEVNLTFGDKEYAQTQLLSAFETDSEWDIEESAVLREDFYYDCCPDPYPTLSFRVRYK